MDLATKVWFANEVRIWGLAITAIVGIISFAATWTHSRWQAELASQKEVVAAQIQRASDERIATAANEAAQANARAAEANLELARYRAPRNLSEMQRALISEKTKQFAGTKFDTAFANADSEQAVFLSQIEATIKQAGWKQIDWLGGDIVINRDNAPTSGIVAVVNVITQFHPDEEEQLKAAALQLVGRFHGSNLITRPF